MNDLISQLTNLIVKGHGRTQLAVNYILQNNYHYAYKECEAILSKDPKFSPVYLLMSIIHIKESQYKEAIACCKKIKATDILYASKAHLMMALIHRELGHIEHAINDIEQALALNNQNHLMFYVYGDLLISGSHWTKAIDAFQQSLELNQQNSMAYYKMAYANQQLGQHQKANVCVKESLNLTPSFSSYMSLGNLLYAQDEIVEALREFKHAMSFNPRIPECLRMIGESYLKLSDLDSAEFYFRTALQIHPKMFDSQTGLDNIKQQRISMLPGSPFPNDRRRRKRILFNFDLHAEESPSTCYGATLVDINCLGALLETDKTLDLGSEINLGLKFDTFQDYKRINSVIVREVDIREVDIRSSEHLIRFQAAKLYYYGIEFTIEDNEDCRFWTAWLDIET